MTGPGRPTPVELLTVGETLACIRARRRLRLGGSLELSIAGAEANVAIGVSRLGHGSSVVGVVGDDELGALVLRTLRAEGVMSGNIRTTSAARTGLMLVNPRPGSGGEVLYYRSGSAGSMLAPSDVELAFERMAPSLLHLTGITPALGPGPRQAILRAVELGNAAGSLLSLDLNFRSKLWTRAEAARVLSPLAREVDILFASADELSLAALEDERLRDEQALAGNLLRARPREVVVTRGARGARLYLTGGCIEREAVPVSVADTVGAGDAFVAGYLTAVLEKLPVMDRLERAALTAGVAVSTQGDWEGLPVRADIEDALRYAGEIQR